MQVKIQYNAVVLNTCDDSDKIMMLILRGVYKAKKNTIRYKERDIFMLCTQKQQKNVEYRKICKLACRTKLRNDTIRYYEIVTAMSIRYSLRPIIYNV